MPRTQCRAVRSVLLLIAVLSTAVTVTRAQNIDPANDGSQYVWGENIGWVNFQPSFGPGVTVTSSSVTGYAWGENIGWINLGPTSSGGVHNDGAGRLSGLAWGENVGWINFAPTGGGVSINGCGEFNGTAWGENIGWIKFRSSGAFPYKLTTSWVPPSGTTTPHTSAAGAGSGWSRTDVTVTLSAAECASSVREVHYTLDSDPEVVTPGSSVSVTVTTEGIHSLTYFSVDNAGTREAASVLSIRIDKTAPVISLASPGNGATYFINENVAAAFAVSDAVSGVGGVASTVAQGSPIATSTLGIKTFSVSATDQAGNNASVTHTYSVIVGPPGSGPRIITTFAGGGSVYGEGGLATDALLNTPQGIAIDASGNVFVADQGGLDFNGAAAPGSFVVRRIDGSTGIITTAAGDGTLGDCIRVVGAVGTFDGVACGDGGPATLAPLGVPVGVAVDQAGNLYITDMTNGVIRKVGTATGIITTVAGGGIPGRDADPRFEGDGGPARAAVLNVPQGVAVDAAGNIYIADTFNRRVRKVDAATGIIDTIAGRSWDHSGTTGEGDGGPARSALFITVERVAVDALGNVYVADAYGDNQGNHARIRKVDAATGVVTTVAGGGTSTGEFGLAVDADLGYPADIALDTAGNLYIAGFFKFRVWVVDPSGAISVLAGTGSPGISGDGGPATAAQFAVLGGIGVAGNGDVYISDSALPGRVRRVAAAASSVDTTPPVISSVPGNIVAQAATSAGAIVNYTAPTALDARDGVVAVTCAPASGTVFAVGTTTVTCSAADAAGNSSSRTFTVSVQDTQPPTFGALMDFATLATSVAGAVVSYPSPTATDTVDPAPIVGCVPASGSAFPIGVTTVTCTAADHSGNTTNGAFSVTVISPDVIVDAATPQSVLDGLTNVVGCVVMLGTSRTTLVMPNLMSIGNCLTVSNNQALTNVDLAAGSIGGSVTITDNDATTRIDLAAGSIGGSVTITDNDDATSIDVGASSIGGDLVIADNDSAGSIDVGATTVNGDVTIARNSSASSIDVGSLSTVGNVNIFGNTSATTIDLSSLAVAAGNVTITGNGSSTVDVGPASIAGGLIVSTDTQTTVDLSATTVAGGVSISTQGTSTVRGSTGGGGTSVTLVNGSATMNALLPANTFATHVPFTIESLGNAGSLTGPILDGSSNTVMVAEVAAYRFTFGITTLNQDATLTFDIDIAALDSASQSGLLAALASNHATLGVQGDAAGSLAQVFAVCATGQAPTAGGCVQVVRLDANGNVIPDTAFVTPATIRFTGITGHFSTFAVVIVTPIPDTVPPIISGVPSPIVAEATSAAGAVVNFAAPTALDARDGAVAVTCAPASGNRFPLGITTVTCAAVDGAGNRSSSTFTVTVRDTTPPGLACPTSLTSGATSASGAIVNYPAATVSDAVDVSPDVIYSPASGTLFPIGTTMVTVTATDASGNSSTCSFTVTITPLAPLGADLSVTNTALPSPVTLGSPLTYTVTIRNNGPSPATDVWILDTVLGSVHFVSATPSQGRCVGVAGLVTCNLGTLASGATTRVTIVVIPKAKGNLTSAAIAWSSVLDRHLANNQATTTTRVK